MTPLMRKNVWISAKQNSVTTQINTFMFYLSFFFILLVFENTKHYL